MPRGELRMTLAPLQLRKTEIDVAERDAERDVTDGELRGTKRVGLIFERIDRHLGFQPPRLHVLDRLLRRRPGHLAAPYQQSVEHAVAERLTAQRDKPLREGLREQLAATRQHVEIFADHRRIVHHRAVGDAQGRQAALRVFLHQLRIWLRRGDDSAHGLDAIGEAAFMRRNHHLAHKRRARRPVQQHVFHCVPSMAKLRIIRARRKVMTRPRIRHGRRRQRMLDNSANCGGGMPIDKRVSFADALDGVSDGATVFITGFGGAGFPNKLIRALRDKGPKNLTLVVNSATHRYSLTHELIANNQVRKVICTAARGHDKEPSPFETRWMAGKIELEMVPQGSFTERIRAAGAGIPAFYTPVGFGTELSESKEIRRFGDRDYVMETAISGDLALVRADIADRLGNLMFNYAQMNFGPAMASAAKLAVAEVRTVSDELLPRERIQLPGVYVDRVVTA